MTYIIGAKINNKCFIVVDKVENFNPSKPSVNKLYNSITNNDIHISLTGDKMLMDIIKRYDKSIKDKLIINNVIIEMFAKQLEEEAFQQNITGLSDVNCIYVIDKDEIFRYWLNFKNDKFIDLEVVNIQNNEMYVNAHRTPLEDVNFKPSVEFLTFWLKKEYESRYNSADEEIPISEYFKDGFNSIEK